MAGKNDLGYVMKSSAFNIDDTDWVKFEKGNAKNIDSKPMDPTGSITTFRVSLMRVRPGGEFQPHSDPYSHFFYVISGSGEGMLGKNAYAMESGQVLIVKAGERHGYRNTGTEPLIFVCVIPLTDTS